MQVLDAITCDREQLGAFDLPSGPSLGLDLELIRKVAIERSTTNLDDAVGVAINAWQAFVTIVVEQASVEPLRSALAEVEKEPLIKTRVIYLFTAICASKEAFSLHDAYDNAAAARDLSLQLLRHRSVN